MRVYTVGNSVTDALNHTQFSKLLQGATEKPIVARQMIPGAPLEWLWNHPNDGFMQKPYGYPTSAFPLYKWDAITLQPFDRGLESDLKFASNYIDLALQNPANKSTKFYIYQRWPRMVGLDGKGVKFDRNNYGKELNDPTKITDYKQLKTWEELFTAPYTKGHNNTNESADYAVKLTQALREKYPDLTIQMIPVGAVLLELDKKMRAGEVEGHTTAWDFYTDGIHMGPAGSYVVGTTFYAAITGKSPVGLPAEGYKVSDPKLAKLIQETAWKVVRETPLSGVK